MEKEKLVFLQEKAKKLRYDVIEMIGRFGVGHIGGCMSVMDALTAIYYDKGNMDAKDPKKQDRDRVVMSKGHAGPAMYAVLRDKGYFPEDWIGTLNKNGKRRKATSTIPQVLLPTRIVSLGFKPDSDNTVELYMDGGWQFSFRIHNASTMVESSLKFDIQIIGMPTTIVTINCRWK